MARSQLHCSFSSRQSRTTTPCRDRQSHEHSKMSEREPVCLVSERRLTLPPRSAKGGTMDSQHPWLISHQDVAESALKREVQPSIAETPHQRHLTTKPVETRKDRMNTGDPFSCHNPKKMLRTDGSNLGYLLHQISPVWRTLLKGDVIVLSPCFSGRRRGRSWSGGGRVGVWDPSRPSVSSGGAARPGDS